MAPEKVRAILPAGRGLGRTGPARFCRRHGFRDVIRIKSDVWVKSAGYEGNLFDYPVKKGVCKPPRGVPEE